MFKKTKNVWIWLATILVLLAFVWTYNTAQKKDNKPVEIVEHTEKAPLNEFLWLYDSGVFEKIDVVNDKKLVWYILLTGLSSEKVLKFDTIESEKPNSTSLKDLWIEVVGWTELNVSTKEDWLWTSVAKEILPLILFLLLLAIIFKFTMPKWWPMWITTKTWTDNTKTKIDTKFSDVAGMEEVKEELNEIVDYLKNPEKYRKVWARPPKWVLLYGQPGSGKTLLARAVAWEANVPFFSASGSEFMEMLVWMWAAKVRTLFQKAKAAWTAIVFIDEIDAIGWKRGVWHTGWHQEQEQTLNQILTEMDGFDNKAHVIVMAATNRPDMLDPALLRAWRFDRKILVSAPTYEERKAIFDYYLKDKKVDKSVNLDSLIKRTSWLVWADIENIVNEASLKLAKINKEVLTESEFEYAIEKVLMWPEKKVKSMQEQEKKTIAYHELWHAVTSHLLPDADKVEKITIVRRWQALWATWKTPEEDKYLYSKTKILQETISLLGWRASEEIFLWKDNITTGASNDFERATQMISDMVMKYWMDDDLWPIVYFDDSKWDYSLYKPYSETTAKIIDDKIKYYIFDCYEKSKKIIKDNKELIEKMSKILLEKEYLTRDEFKDLMDNDWVMKDKSNSEWSGESNKESPAKASEWKKLWVKKIAKK